MQISWKTPKINVEEGKKKKKLYHTVVTQFCKSGGDAIHYWKYANTWKENRELVTIDFNKKHGFVKENYVKMELVKVYKSKKGMKRKKGG